MQQIRALGHPTPLLSLALILALALLAVSGCRAGDEIKRGAIGEYCNERDADCRVGLVCESSRCKATGDDVCGAVCEKLDGECAVESNDCLTTCGLTIRAWSERATDAFAECIGELSCDEAANDAPNLCYNRIEVPQGRDERCEAFTDAARICTDSDTDSTDRVRRSCYAFARVRGEAEWQAADCAEALSSGSCSALDLCLNDSFSIDPPVSLGDASFTPRVGD